MMRSLEKGCLVARLLHRGLQFGMIFLGTKERRS
jgi:hypothetical protein